MEYQKQNITPEFFEKISHTFIPESGLIREHCGAERNFVAELKMVVSVLWAWLASFLSRF
jgi:hypothetical protein